MSLIVILILILIAVLAAEIIREQLYFKINEYTIDTHNRLAGTICFISDLHSKCYGHDNCKLLGAIEALSPDLILIGGDMITSSAPDKMEISLSLLQEISKISPCYYGFGNHEGRMVSNPSKYKGDIFKYLDEVSSMGIRILNNESVRISLNDTDIQLTGITLPSEHYRRTNRDILTSEELASPIKEVDLLKEQKLYNIVLAHDPCAYTAYDEFYADLILSGHYHGGVIRFGQYGLITPQIRLFSPRSYGRSETGKGLMIVTSGAGTHTLPLRLFNPAEIVAIKFN